MTADASAIFTALSNFGAFGILVAFLIWKDTRESAARAARRKEERAEQILHEERRLAYDQARLDTDKALAGSLASLASEIQRRDR